MIQYDIVDDTVVELATKDVESSATLVINNLIYFYSTHPDYTCNNIYDTIGKKWWSDEDINAISDVQWRPVPHNIRPATDPYYCPRTIQPWFPQHIQYRVVLPTATRSTDEKSQSEHQYRKCYGNGILLHQISGQHDHYRFHLFDPFQPSHSKLQSLNWPPPPPQSDRFRYAHGGWKDSTESKEGMHEPFQCFSLAGIDLVCCSSSSMWWMLVGGYKWEGVVNGLPTIVVGDNVLILGGMMSASNNQSYNRVWARSLSLSPLLSNDIIASSSSPSLLSGRPTANHVTVNATTAVSSPSSISSLPPTVPSTAGTSTTSSSPTPSSGGRGRSGPSLDEMDWYSLPSIPNGYRFLHSIGTCPF
jgi:hypothetical protein